MRLEIHCAVSGIKGACIRIRRLDIHANPACALIAKPSRQPAQQTRCNPTAAILRPDGNPLQFAVAAEALCKMAGDEARDEIVINANECNAGSQGLLRMQLTGEVERNPFPPIFLRLPVSGANLRHSWNVGECGFAIEHVMQMALSRASFDHLPTRHGRCGNATPRGERESAHSAQGSDKRRDQAPENSHPANCTSCSAAAHTIPPPARKGLLESARRANPAPSVRLPAERTA